MSPANRRGFTLVELLVVISIIGTLMSLLLPAVNQALEAARAAQCKNNLNQIAKATSVYEGSFGAYPGCKNRVGNNVNVTWPIVLMPNLEQKALYKTWSEAAVSVSGSTIFWELMICPSDPPVTSTITHISYVANAGRVGCSSAADCPTSNTENAANGIFHDRVGGAGGVNALRIGAKYVTDGLSNTLLYSENIQATQWDTTGKRDTVFVWHDTLTPSTNQKINGNKTTTVALTENLARPSSFHPGGVNVAFCDARVIFLREDVDYLVLQQLMTSVHEDSNAPDLIPGPAYILDAGDY